jgi:hypothetical protein
MDSKVSVEINERFEASHDVAAIDNSARRAE